MLRPAVLIFMGFTGFN